MPSSGFQFKQFYIAHDHCAHKVGTDGVLIATWAKALNPLTILDIGSGSGLISLACAQRFAKAQITGIELDKQAFTQAVENATASPFANQIQFLNGDLLQQKFSQPFDLIISNPPFFEGTSSSGKLLRDQARDTSSLPLKHLAEQCAKLLSKHGTLALILPKQEAQQFLVHAENNMLHVQRICKILGAPNAADKRWMLQFGYSKKQNFTSETLCLRDHQNNRSDEYASLTKDFYL